MECSAIQSRAISAVPYIAAAVIYIAAAAPYIAAAVPYIAAAVPYIAAVQYSVMKVLHDCIIQPLRGLMGTSGGILTINTIQLLDVQGSAVQFFTAQCSP